MVWRHRAKLIWENMARNLNTKDKEVKFLILIIEYRRLSFKIIIKY